MGDLKYALLDEDENNTFGATTASDWLVDQRHMTLRAMLRQWSLNEDGHEDTGSYVDTVLDDSDIISYSIDNQNASSGFDIGSVISASYRMTINNTVNRKTPSDFTRMRVAVAIGIKRDGHAGIDYEPYGVWTVMDVSAPEQSTTADLSGMDALGTDFENAFYPFADDDASLAIEYNSVADMINIITTITIEPTYTYEYGNVTEYYDQRYKWNIQDSRHSISSLTSGSVPTMLYILCSEGNVTERQVIAWFAASFGCFARINRNGDLEFRAYDRVYGTGEPIEISPSRYFSFTPLGVEPFSFNRLMASYYPTNDVENEAVANVSTTSDILQAPSNTIQLAATPFMTTTLANTIYGLLTSNLSADAVSLTFCGAPQISIGDHYYVRDLSNQQHKLIVNSMSATYDGGMTMTITCSLPSNNTANSAVYNASQTMLATLTGQTQGKRQYQTAEMVTGNRWIDGSTIYRQIATISSVAAGGQGTYSMGIPFDDIGTVLTISGGALRSNDIYCPIPNPAISSNSVISVYISSVSGTATLTVGAGSASGITDCAVVIEYTKASS